MSEQAVTLVAGTTRQDFSVHEIANSQVGIIEWRPTSNAAKFGLRNADYTR